MSKTNGNTIVLIITSIIGFVYPFMMSSINVALPAIGTEFSMGAVILGWVTTAYTLVSAILQIPMGRLADITGRKKIFTMGLLIQLVATFFCAIADSPAWLITARVVQAIGASMTFSTTMALLSSRPAATRKSYRHLYVDSIYRDVRRSICWGSNDPAFRLEKHLFP